MMRTYEHFQETSQDRSIQRIAIGFFDGLHLGHAKVILGDQADTLAEKTCVITFQQHPFSVLFPDKATSLLTSLEHKLHLLKKWKINAVLTLPFNQQQSEESAETFLRHLQEGFPLLKSISVGPNFRFGHKRLGSLKELEAWCQQNQVFLSVPSPVTLDNEIISSSRIRQTLKENDLEQAQKLLGRPYSLYGTVSKGQQLGRQLGWPTANLSTTESPLCSTGVYAGRALLENGESFQAAINIGYRPTVSEQKKLHIEAHLLHFNQEIYHQKLELELHQKIRDEKTFESLDDLKAQIKKDIEDISN